MLMTQAALIAWINCIIIRVFVLLRAPNSLSLKEQMHEKAGRTIPSPSHKSGEAHGTQRRPKASDLMPSPSLQNPIPHQNITRERTRPQLMERLNVPWIEEAANIQRAANQQPDHPILPPQPKSIPPTRPTYPPPTLKQQPICPESFWSPFIMLHTVDTIDKMATGCQTTKTNVYTHGPQTNLH